MPLLFECSKVKIFSSHRDPYMYDESSVQDDLRLCCSYATKRAFSNLNRGTYGSGDVSSLLIYTPLQVCFHVSYSHKCLDPHQK